MYILSHENYSIMNSYANDFISTESVFEMRDSIESFEFFLNYP